VLGFWLCIGVLMFCCVGMMLYCFYTVVGPPIVDIEFLFYWWSPIAMYFLIGHRICIVVCVF